MTHFGCLLGSLVAVWGSGSGLPPQPLRDHPLSSATLLGPSASDPLGLSSDPLGPPPRTCKNTCFWGLGRVWERSRGPLSGLGLRGASGSGSPPPQPPRTPSLGPSDPPPGPSRLPKTRVFGPQIGVFRVSGGLSPGPPPDSRASVAQTGDPASLSLRVPAPLTSSLGPPQPSRSPKNTCFRGLAGIWESSGGHLGGSGVRVSLLRHPWTPSLRLPGPSLALGGASRVSPGVSPLPPGSLPLPSPWSQSCPRPPASDLLGPPPGQLQDSSRTLSVGSLGSGSASSATLRPPACDSRAPPCGSRASPLPSRCLRPPPQTPPRPPTAALWLLSGRPHVLPAAQKSRLSVGI